MMNSKVGGSKSGDFAQRGVNVGLNTVNNFGTAVVNDGLQGFQNNFALNTTKIIPTVLTGVMGMYGANIMTSTVLPSIYGNGMDAFLNANFGN